MILFFYVAFIIIILIIGIGLTMYRHIVNVLKAEILKRKGYGKEEKTYQKSQETEGFEDD